MHSFKMFSLLSSMTADFLRLMNNLLRSVNGGKVVFLTLLDLSAAFDTIDHGLLLQRLEFENGIIESALACFCSYLA